MSDRTTINIDKETHSKATDRKDQMGHTWPEVLQWYAENAGTDTIEKQPTATVDVTEGMVRSVVSDEIQKHLSEISVNVDLGDMDLEGSELAEEDVRNIVTREIEKSVHERARQL